MSEDDHKEWSLHRRDFLKLLGFSVASAACSRMPVEKAIPFLVKPEETIPGVANWYASTCAGCTAACPILVKVRDGRPIKIEGNRESPQTRGGLCAVGQATLLSLYDDARLRGPLLEGKETSWDEIDLRVRKELEAASGKIALITGTIVSPATREVIGEFVKKYPGTRVASYDALSSSALLLAGEKSFGLKVLPHYRFDRARVIVSFNADFLGSWISPVAFSRDYVAGRKVTGKMSRHIQFESRMSLTGSNADLRVPIGPSEEKKVLQELLREVTRKAGHPEPAPSEVEGAVGTLLKRTAEELWENRGASLVVSGSNDLSIQLMVNTLNSLLGNIGQTVDLDNPSFQRQGDEREVVRLVDEMKAGGIQVLLLYGVNPVYDFPEKFDEALKKVPFSLSFADRLDETASLTTAVCPDHHFLESWHDANPEGGFLSLTQPTIRPLFATRQAEESLLRWMGRSENFYTYLRESWRKNQFPKSSGYLTFDAFWDHSVQQGIFTVAAAPSKTHPLLVSSTPEIQEATSPAPFELVLHENIPIRDGRHANNPWLQELPDPVTKVVWDNYASLAPKTAETLGLEEGDVVRVKSDRGEVELPLYLQPGQAEKGVAVALGYGRTKAGKAGNGVGVNLFPLVTFVGGLFRYEGAGVTLEKTGRKSPLASTQTHHSMEGRPIIKETTLEEYRKNPSAGNEEHEKLYNLWADKPKEGHAWGMAIDLAACTGCSACVTSCQAENNVAVVGKKEVGRSREMHWIRIDRYYNGPEENPETVHQPMMCQHCGHAPCETVCPVLATVHSSDGLSQQVYNRCVGTRYCENNCPYKVRRFNWFEYARNEKFDYHLASDLGRMVLNPDLVVRSRGVMEKCSFCIQRIQEGKLTAKKEGRLLPDGAIQTACQQSCPTQAIVFGDLNDPESEISKLNKEDRFYHVLEELNIQPVVGYLTKVRNKG